MSRGLRFTIIGSAVTHLLVVIALIAGTAGSGRTMVPTETVIATKLVRLGKERQKDLLPRKEQPPQPAAKPAVNLAPEAKPTNTSNAPAKAVEKATKPTPSLSDALQRLRKNDAEQEEPEGREDGSVYGTSLTEALIGNKYVTEIYNCVKSNYTIEGLSPERVRGRKTTVAVRVNTDGTFFDIKVENSSGLKAFDGLVVRAVKRCGKVSPPPKQLGDAVREEGVLIEFTPEES